MTDSKPAVRTTPGASTAKPRASKAKPSGSRVARFHYHQNRAAGTFIVHQKVEVGSRSVVLDLKETEFESISKMTKAVSDCLAANDHSFDTLVSTKHCN
jgi:hypothetical protein